MLLEGTFPYVAGGVSTWVYDLIRAMDDLTFSIVYLGAHRRGARKIHYPIPKNVTDFREIHIFDYQMSTRPVARAVGAKESELLREFLLDLKQLNTSSFAEAASLFGGGSQAGRRLRLEELAYSFDIWKIVEETYLSQAPGVSFIDYFWTWRFIYLPFFALLGVRLPQAGVYHCVSTGYAGVLGALGKLQHSRPLVITEHGIYTRERKIEISQAEWIYSEQADQIKVMREQDFFKEWWMGLFSFFSRLAYDQADEIIALFEGNRKIQIEEGALPEKTRIIPNAIDADSYSYHERREQKGKFRIGFMGRVVPIKDVKSFIRACRIIYNELPDIEVSIMGPLDEDEEYYRECLALVEEESLGGIVKFHGKVNTRDYYPGLDVLVLTSISEGQPIVILEAGASGIPVVASDVGACRELLYGSSPDDKLIGKSGVVAPMYNPEATAGAVLAILRDPDLRARMGRAGQKRVNTYYRSEDLFARYHELYYKYSQEL